MENPNPVIKVKGKNTLKIILWILLPILLVSPLAIKLVFEVGSELLLYLFLLGIADLFLLSILSEKYYNWPILFFLIFFTGLFFRRHWYGIGNLLIIIALMVLIMASLVNSIRFQIVIKKNPFLRWFGSISSFIIAIYVTSWLFLMMGESREIGDIFSYTGVFLFIISVLGMVFTLPGSNYINWTAIERKIFFRAILVPMVIVFGLIIIGNVFTDVYFWISNRLSAPWNVQTAIELFNLEGIPKI
jgi:hypothetical protein